MIRYLRNARKGIRPLPGLLGAGALALSLGACDTDRLVQVSDPARLTPEEIDNADAIPALMSGALRQFVGGYSGFGDDSFLSSSGVISDELYYGDTFTTRNAADQRNLQPPQLGNISDLSYGRLHQARLNARRAYASIARFASERPDAPAGEQALMRTVEGYTYVTLSEGWCGSVPFSRLPDSGAINPADAEFSRGLTTDEMSDTAIARFNDALAAGGAPHLTRIGLARALQNKGEYAAAAAAVAAVPTGYVYHLEHSSNLSSQYNPIFSLIDNGRYGVSNLEGGSETLRHDLSLTPDDADPTAEGIAFRGLQDPRVPHSNLGGCFSASVRCWMNNNYTSYSANVPLASGVEARLIEAEAAHRRGAVGEMLAILNSLRANVAPLLDILHPDQVQVFSTDPLPALSDPGEGLPDLAAADAARRRLLFQERALWLYNTGHRQGDLRRLVRHYNVPSNQAFPSGAFFRGGSYGDDVAYPVPFAEQNNPQFVRSQCVTSQA